MDPETQLQSPATVPDDLPEDCLLSYNPSKILSANASLTQLERQAAGEKSGSTTGELLSCAEMAAQVQAPSSFTLRKLVGKGGFGEVWEATQGSLHRIVAVKRLRDDIFEELSESASMTRSEMECQLDSAFRQEALTTANLDHPNIVPVHDLGTDENGRPLMAMKFIRGTPWDEQISEDAPEMSVDDFLAKHIPILVDMAQAVAFAHSRGVVHRDLKPSQVIVGEYGEVLLADWGLSVVYDPDRLRCEDGDIGASFLPTRDSAPSPAGTPAYMAPEQTEKTSENIGPWTDIYLLGGVLYFLLTLRRPHQASSSKESFLKARLGKVTPPREAAEGRAVPDDLAALAEKAMQENPKHRHASALEFVEGLQDHLSGAGRRRQSISLTDDVARMMENSPGTYAVYAECLSKVSQATALWGGNPKAADLTEKARRAMCELALKNGDLRLARVQIDYLQDSPCKIELSAAVDSATASLETQKRQRRLAIAVAVVLLIGIMFISAGFNYRLNSQQKTILNERDEAMAAQEEAQAARDAAMKARTDAQELVNFMLEDLRLKLSDTSTLSSLQEIGDKLLSYYEGLPEAAFDNPDTKRKYAEALTWGAELARDLGDTQRAYQLIQRLHVLADNAVAENPGDAQWNIQLAYSHILLGFIGEDRGHSASRHLGILNALASIARYIQRTQATDSEQKLSQMDFDSIQQFLHRQQNLDELIESPEVLSRMIEVAMNWNIDDPEWASNISFAYLWISDMLAEEGKTEVAIQLAQEGVEKRKELLDAHPEMPDNRQNVLLFRLGLADVYTKLNRYEEAEKEYKGILETAALRSKNAPADRFWKEALARANLGLAQIALAQDLTEQFEAYAKSAVATAEEVRNRDPDNVRGLLLSAESQQLMAAIQKRSSDVDGAAQSLESAMERYVTLLRRDPRNARWKERLVLAAENYLELADVVEQSGQKEKATEMRGQIGRIAQSLPSENHQHEVSPQRSLKRLIGMP